LKELSERAKNREGDPEQQNLFEQYRRVLGVIAKQQPILLLLDDLQWADGASISLLFHLGRRLGQSCVLILGAYRPDEVAAGRAGERHPLEKVLAEFKRQYGDVWVDLREEEETEGRAFIDAYLNLESNRLGEDFRAEMYRHTGGFPLFTLELLQDMRERGDLVLDEDGYWVEGRDLDWDQLPAKVEGVIEERVGRLDTDLQDLLSIAAVEGARFTVQVLAGAQERGEPQEIEKLVDRLEQSQGLVVSDGIEALDGRKMYRYRFQHVMFQQYLYHQLSAVKRELLHAGVGRALETLYAERTDRVAVQLVQHFDQAGETEKVLRYAVQAGDRARRLGASLEALDFYHMALPRAAEMVSSVEGYEVYRIHERLGDVYLLNLSQNDEALEHYISFHKLVKKGDEIARGARKIASVHLMYGNLKEAEEFYKKALSKNLKPSAETSRVYFGLAYVNINRNQLIQAEKNANQGYRISQEVDSQIGIAEANKVLGIIASKRGELEDAVRYDEHSLTLYKETGDLVRTAQGYNNLGDSFRLLGKMKQAHEYLEKGLELTRRIGNIRVEAILLITKAELFLDQGDWDSAIETLLRVVPLAEESGTAIRRIEVNAILGSAYASSGELKKAQEHLEISEALSRDMGFKNHLPGIYIDMSRIKAAQGLFKEAHEGIEAALSAAGMEPTDLFLGRMHYWKSQVHQGEGDWESSISHLMTSLKFVIKAKRIALEGKARLSLGMVLASRDAEGDKERACEELVTARSIFNRIDARRFMDQADSFLKEVECKAISSVGKES
jgi:tetratricopeptide (TPR) repeat protein